MSDTALTVTFDFNAAIAEGTYEASGPDPWSGGSGGLIDRFLDFMWLKHGLPLGTLQAYRRDLSSLDHWLLQRKDTSVVNANADDIREFLAQAEGAGRSREDTPTLSCIKRFFGFLLDRGFRSDDPTQIMFVRAPRLMRRNV